MDANIKRAVAKNLTDCLSNLRQLSDKQLGDSYVNVKEFLDDLEDNVKTFEETGEFVTLKQARENVADVEAANNALASENETLTERINAMQDGFEKEVREALQRIEEIVTPKPTV